MKFLKVASLAILLNFSTSVYSAVLVRESSVTNRYNCDGDIFTSDTVAEALKSSRANSVREGHVYPQSFESTNVESTDRQIFPIFPDGSTYIGQQDVKEFLVTDPDFNVMGLIMRDGKDFKECKDLSA
ncbi:BgTH12-05810 [Blumeria graminis f. sp. triticale]|uniref:BgtE-5784 n=3 Tax=Blumeria graminis TaxID=34373 RepID=A0A381LE60_BLUGR|nr:putative secreted effector protein [Blumeria graminis f. sp. tritici 96224]CAD6504073.1 BgTH12-05810 [Blumeria graminis f. sp. triticale]VDB90810.1 BgtE-5784 [Blumeria graminis f. sp. tritici]